MICTFCPPMIWAISQEFCSNCHRILEDEVWREHAYHKIRSSKGSGHYFLLTYNVTYLWGFLALTSFKKVCLNQG